MCAVCGVCDMCCVCVCGVCIVLCVVCLCGVFCVVCVLCSAWWVCVTAKTMWRQQHVSDRVWNLGVMILANDSLPATYTVPVRL